MKRFAIGLTAASLGFVTFADIDTFTYAFSDGAITDKASIRVDIKRTASNSRSTRQR